MKKTLSFLILLGLLISPMPAQAEEGMTISEAAASEDYLTKASGQFFRGITNVGLSWLEFYLQPKKEMDSGGSAIKGVGNGFLQMLVRIGHGLNEILVFLSPRTKDGQYPRVRTDSIFDALEASSAPAEDDFDF